MSKFKHVVHTSRPWRCNGPDSTLILGADNSVVATTLQGEEDYEENYDLREGNAELIVMAVNSYGDAPIVVAQDRDFARLIDNAATASQNISLLDDPVTREAIQLNIIDPVFATITELVEALTECAEYFDTTADADHDYETGFIPNREMRLLQVCDEALKLARKS